MSITLIAWLVLFATFAVLAFVRPAWGCALYMLTFFASPALSWWGKATIGDYRWALYGGIGFLVSVLVSRAIGFSSPKNDSPRVKRMLLIASLILANATLVHVLLAPNMTISSGPYTLLAKFVVFFGLIVASVRTEKDLRIVLLSIVIGAAYIGFEVTVNDRGHIEGSRLEGVGVAAASSANSMANLMITVLPLTGAFFLAGKPWERLAMILAAPFILNVILLCNSRGAFLGAIACAVCFVLFAPRAIRVKTLKVAALGCVALWFLLGDSRIVERFFTTFANAEERDSSATSRLDYWAAGMRMISDHPLGAGGDGFHDVYGPRYIHDITGADFEVRSVHNGFINEACDWGIQGLILRLALMGSALLLLGRVARKAARSANTFGAVLGCSMIAGIVAFLCHSMFGDFLDSEWGLWLAAAAIGYSRVYAHGHEPRNYQLQPSLRAGSTVQRPQNTFQSATPGALGTHPAS